MNGCMITCLLIWAILTFVYTSNKRLDNFFTKTNSPSDGADLVMRVWIWINIVRLNESKMLISKNVQKWIIYEKCLRVWTTTLESRQNDFHEARCWRKAWQFTPSWIFQTEIHSYFYLSFCSVNEVLSAVSFLFFIRVFFNGVLVTVLWSNEESAERPHHSSEFPLFLSVSTCILHLLLPEICHKDTPDYTLIKWLR